jgi:signal transduction histidine kinase
MNGGFGPAGVRTRAGELWFPGVKGAVRIDPTRIRIAHPSPVLIESITADDKPVPLSDAIQIPAGHGKLAIGYTSASLISPERMSFRYKLEGFDPDWNTASTLRAAYYTNLPPGRYRFRVMAMDSAAPKDVSEASVAFLWRPHFHQTAWFYGLCVVAAALAGWTALRVYARQTQARYAVMLAERTRLARDMHDTVIQGCVGVSTLLEAASGFQQSDTGRMTTLLDQARVQIRLTLDEARQAVWDLRHAQLDGDIAGTLRYFAKQLSAEKGIPIDVEFAGAPPDIAEPTLRNILLVAREAIRNAANHGSPGRIRIQMSFEPNEACLEVRDDGRGFAPAAELMEANGHYGIVGMRERVEQSGGSFLLNSSPGHGTSVIARLPLARSRS